MILLEALFEILLGENMVRKVYKGGWIDLTLKTDSKNDFLKIKYFHKIKKQNLVVCALDWYDELLDV